MERNLSNEEIIKRVEEYVNSTYIPSEIQKYYIGHKVGDKIFRPVAHKKLYKTVVVLSYGRYILVNCRFKTMTDNFDWNTFYIDLDKDEIGECDSRWAARYLQSYTFSNEYNEKKEYISQLNDEEKMKEFKKRDNRLDRYVINILDGVNSFSDIHFNINEYIMNI